MSNSTQELKSAKRIVANAESKKKQVVLTGIGLILLTVLANYLGELVSWRECAILLVIAFGTGLIASAIVIYGIRGAIAVGVLLPVLAGTLLCVFIFVESANVSLTAVLLLLVTISISVQLCGIYFYHSNIQRSLECSNKSDLE